MIPCCMWRCRRASPRIIPFLLRLTNYRSKMGVYALLKSTDGGQTWYAVQGLPSTALIAVAAFSPAYATDQTIFTAGNGCLFVSTNQGASWSTLASEALTDVALSPLTSPPIIRFSIVTTKKQIFKSTNRGKKWSPILPPLLLTSGLTLIAVSPNFADDHTLLLGSIADGVYESTNGGTTWNQVTPGLTLPPVTGLAFSPAFSTDYRTFATTLGSGLLVSNNGGSIWKFSNSGLSDLQTTALALSPAYTQDSTVWVTAANGGVFQSTNTGASWSATIVSRALSSLSDIHYQSIAAAVNGSDNVLFLGMYEGLWTSNADVISWQYIDTLPTRLIRHINLSPDYTNDQTIFANSYRGGNLVVD